MFSQYNNYWTCASLCRTFRVKSRAIFWKLARQKYKMAMLFDVRVKKITCRGNGVAWQQIHNISLCWIHAFPTHCMQDAPTAFPFQIIVQFLPAHIFPSLLQLPPNVRYGPLQLITKALWTKYLHSLLGLYDNHTLNLWFMEFIVTILAYSSQETAHLWCSNAN